MATRARRITEDELSKHLDEVLSEVQAHGTTFSIVRADVVLATIQPAGATQTTTLREVINSIGKLPFPGDGFADDLEAIQAAQQPPNPPAWPS